MARKSVDQDFGLLQAVDERLACYGWLTNTGVKFVIVVDMSGRPAGAEPRPDGRAAAAAIVGLRDADLKPVCPPHSLISTTITLLCYDRGSREKGGQRESRRKDYRKARNSGMKSAKIDAAAWFMQAFKALQNAYVRLLQNPFYNPDEHTPLAPNGEYRGGGTQITSRKFASDVRRIGELWAPGVTAL